MRSAFHSSGRPEELTAGVGFIIDVIFALILDTMAWLQHTGLVLGDREYAPGKHTAKHLLDEYARRRICILLESTPRQYVQEISCSPYTWQVTNLPNSVALTTVLR